MPTEVARKTSVRRIYAPDDDSTYIDLKVIDEITFMDERSGFQESVVTLANNLDADRKVKVAEVGESKLKVERILKIGHLDEREGFQQTVFTLQNEPPTHQKTHKTKVYALNPDKSKNTDVWIEVERIDEIAFLDEREGFQETIFTLAAPDLDNPEWDYTGLTPPQYDGRKGGLPINPPYRLDPYQNITDCQFDNRVLLVLYGTNQIAALSIDSKGAFKLKEKKTLAQSKWEKPADWSTEFQDVEPTFFLKTAQMKAAKNFRPMTCAILVDGGVIKTAHSDSNGWEQRPMYDLADTLHKYALGSSWEEEWWNFAPDPIINATATKVFTEKGDTFEKTKDGIKKIASIHDILDWPASMALHEFSCVDTNGGRWTRIAVESGSHNINCINDFVSAFSEVQANYYYDLQESDNGSGYGWMSISYRFGPGVNDYSGGFNPDYRDPASGGTVSIDTKLGVLTQKGGLDVITPTTITCTTMADDLNPAYGNMQFTTNYNGVVIFNEQLMYTTYTALEVMQFPYARNNAKTSSMFYVKMISPWRDSGYNYYYECHTPYETWVTPTYTSPDGFGGGSMFDYLRGWLQLSDGTHNIQGYLKMGKRRIFMNGVEVGTKIAAAIGCDIETIVTMFLGVKMSDVAKLK